MQTLCLLFSWLVLSASATAPGDYRIGPGDQVKIVVHGQSENFSETDFLVGATGEVSFPFVGKIEVAGLTPFQAEEAIEAKLRDGYIRHPQVTVHVESFNSQSVDVMGAVKQPGVYNLDGPTTVRGLLAKAGGIDANLSNGFVVVNRDGQTTRLALKELESAAGDFVVSAGDVVDVEQGTNIFLAGEVAKPGAVPFVEGITVSQALLMAGGSSEFARLAGAYVVRGDERISINLKRVLKGKDADLALQPGDRVVVPMSPL